MLITTTVTAVPPELSLAMMGLTLIGVVNALVRLVLCVLAVVMSARVLRGVADAGGSSGRGRRRLAVLLAILAVLVRRPRSSLRHRLYRRVIRP